ncbi:MAG: hypothetical protein IJ593_08705, partial [Lachnospiraceae bacterium]|nr:hypothetical protein [Lachnospiraceae bacterium]
IIRELNKLKRFNYEDEDLVHKNSEYSDNMISLPYTRFNYKFSELKDAMWILENYIAISNLDSENIYVSLKVESADELNEVECWETSEMHGNVNNSSIEFESNTDDVFSSIVSNTVTAFTNYGELEKGLSNNIIKRCLAVKTPDLSYVINNESDIAHTVIDILALSNLSVDDIIDKLENVYGTYEKLISKEKSGNRYTIQINGNDYYMLNVNQSQLMWALLNLNNVASTTKQMSIKVEIYKDAYMYYIEEFNSNDAYEMSVVNSFIGYIADRRK